MNLFLQTIESQLSIRSKREKILLSIALTLGIYLCFFHSFLMDSLHQIIQLKENIQQSQTYLGANKSQDIAKDLSNAQQLNLKLISLIATLNAQSLPIFAILKTINDYALIHKIALWEVDTEEEDSSYIVSLIGNAPLEDLLAFLSFLENLSMIHLLSFEVLKNGDFKLSIKNHSINSTLSPDNSLSPAFVLQQIRQSLQKEKLSFSFLNPSSQSIEAPTQSSLELQALLNQKAKINGKWLKEGELIEGYRLEKIQNGQVLLQSNDSFIQLKLKNDQVFE